MAAVYLHLGNCVSRYRQAEIKDCIRKAGFMPETEETA